MHSISCQHDRHSLKVAHTLFSKRYMPIWSLWYTEGAGSHQSSRTLVSGLRREDHIERMQHQIDNPQLGGYRLFWVLQDEAGCKFYSREVCEMQHCCLHPPSDPPFFLAMPSALPLLWSFT